MALPVGARVGTCEITGVLGAGGMGEVYRARDTRLGRDVALKVLPPAFSQDADRLARFEREAQVLAALNHPHIAQIYGVEGAAPNATDAGGEVHALIMELVEGETLLDHVARGPVPVATVLRLVPQLVDALDTAHEHGIVHRDLKPANIKVREDGTLKVLDFGLAKALTPGDRGEGEAEAANSPTITTPAMTRAGVILGTAAYMSPEQARGKRVDKRADIWAFGCVVYEMLSGRQPFDGETVTDTLAAIVTKEPDWTALPASTPLPLRRLLSRCLVKDPRQRLRDIGDARAELSGTLEGPDPAGALRSGAAPGRFRAALPWALAAVAATLAVVAWTRAANSIAAVGLAAPSIRFTVPAPEGAILAVPGTVRASGVFTISPDGRQLAILADGRGGRLWVRPIDGLTARLIPGTEGASNPFWSPDGRRLGFFTQNQLKTVTLEPGVVQVVTTVAGGTGGTWSADGTILFSNNQRRIHRIPASGGDPVQVLELDAARGDGGHRWPVFLPDGRQFLFFIGNTDPPKRGVYIGALDSATASFVVNADANALFADGRLLYVRDGTLFAQPFDVDRRVLSGEPQIVVQNVALNTTTRKGEFSVSVTGVLAYTSASLATTQLAWFDRAGQKLGAIEGYGHQAIAPDDRRVAVDRVDSSSTSGRDVWVFDQPSGTRTRLTFSAGDDWVPEWSPDGTRVAFTSSRDTPGVSQIYVKDASGAGSESLLLETDRDKHHMSWSTDGKYLAYEETGGVDGRDIWVLPLVEPGGRPRPVLQHPYNEAQPAFSPDSRYLGYISNESGRLEVYVQTFPATGGRWQVSSEGGIQPRWRRDGREMYYLDAQGRIMALDVDLKMPRFGVPTPLFQTGLGGDAATEHFAVTSDGTRFLMADRESGQTEFTVVVNWQSLLGAAKP